jgi:cephalosporin-C deacetylase
MPILDMPLDQLKSYRGITPCPADFDAYWERALAEMKATDPKIELKPHPTSFRTMETFDLFFTGTGGARIHARLAKPKKTAGKNKAIIHFHGYSWRAFDWTEMLPWAAEGYVVASLDCRGQGGLSEDIVPVKGMTLRGHIVRGIDDHEDKLYYRNMFLDCAQLAGIVMGLPEVDDKHVYAMGGSQGGALTIVCAALEPRIRKAAPAYPFLSDYKRVWEMDLDVAAYEDIRYYLKTFHPTHDGIEKIFTKLGYIDIQNLAKRIKAEVMMATGLRDNICPPSTQFACYNKILSKKSMVMYPDFGHESLPGWNEKIFDFFSGD